MRYVNDRLLHQQVHAWTLEGVEHLLQVRRCGFLWSGGGAGVGLRGPQRLGERRGRWSIDVGEPRRVVDVVGVEGVDLYGLDSDAAVDIHELAVELGMGLHREIMRQQLEGFVGVLDLHLAECQFRIAYIQDLVDGV